MEKENEMADENLAEEQKRYNSNPADLAAEQADDMSDTARKIPADKSEQKVTRSTEGSVEKTTSRSGDRNR